MSQKFYEGRPFTEMPSLMARICGICPVSHLVASSRAYDALATTYHALLEIVQTLREGKTQEERDRSDEIRR